MHTKIASYVLAGILAFALLWWLTIPEIALTLFGMPLLAVLVGAIYERAVGKDSYAGRVERRRAVPGTPSPFRRRSTDMGGLAHG